MNASYQYIMMRTVGISSTDRRPFRWPRTWDRPSRWIAISSGLLLSTYNTSESVYEAKVLGPTYTICSKGENGNDDLVTRS